MLSSKQKTNKKSLSFQPKPSKQQNPERSNASKEGEFCASVANLPAQVSTETLRVHFGPFDNNVSYTITGQGPKNAMAVVSFSSKEILDNVLSRTHAIDGCILKLSRGKQQARLQPPSKRPLEVSGKNKEESPPKKVCSDATQVPKMRLEGLGIKTTKETLIEYLTRYGKVIEAVFQPTKSGKNKKRIAYITFRKENSAKAATRKTEHLIDGVSVDASLVYGPEAEEPGPANGAASSSDDDEDDDEEEGDKEEESDEDEEEESSDDDNDNEPQQSARKQVQNVKKQVAVEEIEDDDDDSDEEGDDDDSDEEESDDDEPHEIYRKQKQGMKKWPTAEDSDDDDDESD